MVCHLSALMIVSCNKRMRQPRYEASVKLSHHTRKNPSNMASLNKNTVQTRKQIHRKLVEDLQKDLKPQEVDELKSVALSLPGVRRGSVSQMHTARELLEILEVKGSLEVGNYDVLKKLFTEQMESPGLIKAIIEAEVKLKALDSDQESLSEKGASEAKKRRNAESIGVDEDDGILAYDVSSDSELGLCIIFNNFTCERKGTFADENEIRRFFKDTLKYKVVTFHDVNKEAFLSCLEDIKRDLSGRLNDYQRFVCFVLSHGDENGVKTCKNSTEHDGQYISVDEIVRPFNSVQLKKLTGKPKMFFFQMCRGSDYMPGVFHDNQASPTTEVEEIPDLLKRLTTPQDADILITYSTTEGHVSWRHPYEGSWFIYNLMEVFKADYTKSDILRMLTKVNQRVSERATSSCWKQMPCFVSTLTRSLYLDK